MSRANLALWAAFVVFVAAALGTGWQERPFAFGGRLAGVKLALWLSWAAFLAYSLHVSRKEDLLQSLREIGRIQWGRQVGLDLYLGLTLSLLVIGLHGGSPWVALVWAVPVYLFGNLATLPWFAIHWDGLVARMG